MHGHGLRIYTYHNIDRAPAGAALPKLYVDPVQFERQCRWLQRLGMRGVSMGEGHRALQEGRARITERFIHDIQHDAPPVLECPASAT